MKFSRLVVASLYLGLSACSISEGGGETGSETEGEWTPTAMLGDACSDDLECVTAWCEFGTCRLPCRDYASCVSDATATTLLNDCINFGVLSEAECAARLEGMNSRVHTCLWEGELDTVNFNKGGCTLATERDCDQGSCPGSTVCDPNGMCRMPCETADDCIPSPTVACHNGLCYDGTDKGFKRIDQAGGPVVGPDLSATVTFGSDAVPEPSFCAVVRADELYDPVTLWDWSFAYIGWSLSCHLESDDRILNVDDTWGELNLAFDLSPIALPEGLSASDISLCPFHEPECARAELDGGSGMASAPHPQPPDYVFPTLSEHVSASIGADNIECAIQPRSDYGTELAFASAPPSVGHPHFAECWSGSFEFRVKNITGGLDGSYDLSDPMTWSTFEISATIDDQLYGLKDGIGGGTGASGTLDYTGFPSMVGIKHFARLTDATLVADDDPTKTIGISEALLIALPD